MTSKNSGSMVIISVLGREQSFPVGTKPAILSDLALSAGMNKYGVIYNGKELTSEQDFPESFAAGDYVEIVKDDLSM